MRYRYGLLTVIIVAAIFATGCSDMGTGSDNDGNDASNESESTPTQPSKIALPDQDSELVAELGKIGAKAVKSGCKIGTLDIEEAEHVNDVGDLSWKTLPAASGAHFPDWAPFGVYDEEVGEGYVVHNLEHGGVAVLLGSSVDDEVAQAIMDEVEDGEKWLISPRSGFEPLVSIAWGKMLRCSNDQITKLGGPEASSELLRSWFDAVESTGSDVEKDVPAYAGAMREPVPVRDTSIPVDEG